MPLPLLLPAIIGAAGSLGAGLLAKKGGMGGPTPQQTALSEQQTANAKLSGDWAKTVFPQGQNLLDLSKSTYQVPLNFWGGIAGGSRQQATSLLAPEINRINEGEASSRTAASNLFARSGGSSTYMLDSVFAPQRAISNLLQTARPTAMTNLADLAGKFASTGSGLFRDASGFLNSSSSSGAAASRDLLEQERMRREQQAAFGKSIGGILADITRGIVSRGGKESRTGGLPRGQE